MKIEFPLDIPKGFVHIPVRYLQAKGFDRRYILLVFEELSMLGCGNFERGGRGRAHYGYFAPNESCPKTYELELKEK